MLTKQTLSNDVSRDRRKPGLAADLLRLILVGIGFLGLALLVRHGLHGDTRAGLQELRQFLQGSEIAGGRWLTSMIFIAVGSLAISVGVPRLWVSGVAGAVYGALLGIAVALTSSLVGAAVVYLLGQRFLASVVKRRFGGRLGLWRQRFHQNAFWWVLYGRLIPFSNATLTSLLCGSCRVPFSRYLIASFIGFIPLTIVFAAFGSGGLKGNINQIYLGFGLLLAAFFARWIFSRRMPTAAEQAANKTESRPPLA